VFDAHGMSRGIAQADPLDTAEAGIAVFVDFPRSLVHGEVRVATATVRPGQVDVSTWSARMPSWACNAFTAVQSAGSLDR
jgi:hypothetical protein